MVFSPLSASLVPEPWTGSDAGSACRFHSCASARCFLSLAFFHDVKVMRQATAIMNMRTLASSTYRTVPRPSADVHLAFLPPPNRHPKYSNGFDTNPINWKKKHQSRISSQSVL